MLLDTSFLIDLMRGEPDAIAKAQELESNLVQQRLAAMSLFELYYGIARVDDTETERGRVREVLESKPVHPADVPVMRKAGRIAGELATEGEPIDDGDVIIAATALVVDEPVLTRNADHFERVDGIEVEVY